MKQGSTKRVKELGEREIERVSGEMLSSVEGASGQAGCCQRVFGGCHRLTCRDEIFKSRPGFFHLP